MNEWMLHKALESNEEVLTHKAISARLSRARTAERILQEDLDNVVDDDDKTYAALLALKKCSSERGGNLQNALRWYYRAVNNREFPKLSDFHPGQPYAFPTDSVLRGTGAESASQSLPAKPAADVAQNPHRPIEVLWGEYCAAKNEISAALGRSHNVVGELAERIVAQHHGGELLGVSFPSADVRLEDKTLLQVKSRMMTGPGGTSLSTIRSWNFDVLSVVLFDMSGKIVCGGEMPCTVAQRYAKQTRHVNGWTITVNQKFREDSAFSDMTEQYRDALKEL